MNLLPKKSFANLHRGEGGQALLLILLSMSVVLVVGLSIVSRSVTDISTTSKEESSTRAFNAAESGVERALVTGSGGNGSLGTSNFNSTVSSVGKSLNSFSYPAAITGGDSAAAWFVSRTSTGAINCVAPNVCFSGASVNICWGTQGTPSNTATTPALEVQYYYTTIPGNYSGTRMMTASYDPNAARLATNGFLVSDPGTCTIGTKTYAFQKNIVLGALGMGNPAPGTQGTSILMNLRLLYNTTGHEFGLIAPAGSTFAAQGNLIDSSGSDNGANRRLSVFQSVGETPGVFNNVVYTEGSVSK